MESHIIAKANEIGRLDSDNKNKGNNPKVDKFRRVELGQYLEEAFFLMELIGIDVLTSPSSSATQNRLADYASTSIDTRTKLIFGKRAEKIAREYVESQGIALTNEVRYASLQDSGKGFWVNPRTYLLKKDWSLLLNDNQNGEILILRIPADALHLESEASGGLVTRTDGPEKIQLRIHRSTLVDSTSGVDFSPYLTHRLRY